MTRPKLRLLHHLGAVMVMVEVKNPGELKIDSELEYQKKK